MRIAILGVALAVAGCGGGGGDGADGPAARRDFQVGAFDRVALAGNHDVTVAVGGAPSVRAEGRERALDRLEVEVRDGVLRIGSRRHDGWWPFGGSNSARVHVTVPSLAAASVTGSGDMRIDRIEGERFEGRVAGSGGLGIDAMRVGEARFAVAGSGDLAAAGTSGRTEVSVAGSGDVELHRLRSTAAAVTIAGSGDVDIHATETADIEIRGSGEVRVTGPARCTVRKSGSGEVRCEGERSGS